MLLQFDEKKFDEKYSSKLLGQRLILVMLLQFDEKKIMKIIRQNYWVKD